MFLPLFIKHLFAWPLLEEGFAFLPWRQDEYITLKEAVPGLTQISADTIRTLQSHRSRYDHPVFMRECILSSLAHCVFLSRKKFLIICFSMERLFDPFLRTPHWPGWFAANYLDI
jgi:hypothetical protein